jgi:hypothetical protein
MPDTTSTAGLDPAETFSDATALLADPSALRARAAGEGCLFFAGLLDRERVLDLRGRFLEILSRHGWLAEGSDSGEARPGREAVTENDPDFRPVFDDFQRLRAFHAMAHAPAILGAMIALFGDPALPHPRNIGRIMFPDAPVTPPHQDFIHIRGTENTWTAWIPLGDCPRTVGGLAVLPGSHQGGLLPETPMAGADGLPLCSSPFATLYFSCSSYEKVLAMSAVTASAVVIANLQGFTAP